jgi:hypothetical protein
MALTAVLRADDLAASCLRGALPVERITIRGQYRLWRFVRTSGGLACGLFRASHVDNLWMCRVAVGCGGAGVNSGQDILDDAGLYIQGATRT